MKNRFYKINEIRQHKYYQIPRELYENPRYKTTINNDAKVLYALLLDRMELSRVNKWVDDDGTIFLMFKREDLADMLGICMTTICKAFKQLKSVGLIAEKRQGLCKPNIIYIGKIGYDSDQEKNLRVDCDNLTVQSVNKQSTDDVNNNTPDCENVESINTEMSITDLILNKSIDTESLNTKAEYRNIDTYRNTS